MNVCKFTHLFVSVTHMDCGILAFYHAAFSYVGSCGKGRPDKESPIGGGTMAEFQIDDLEIF